VTELELADGWVEPELAEEFPHLCLLHAAVEVRPGGSPREVKQRLRMLADRYTGGKVVHMRQDPVPWAYRVSEDAGVTPETERMILCAGREGRAAYQPRGGALVRRRDALRLTGRA
jgi:hypothetical protein